MEPPAGADSVPSVAKTIGVAQQFSQGNINFTDNALDLAIGGEGFFVLSDNGARLYTRAGAFGIDNQGNVVNAQGHRLQAYPFAGNGLFNTGTPQDLQLATGANAPQATTAALMGINLPANAAVPVPQLVERGAYLPGAIGGDQVPPEEEETFGVLPEDIAGGGLSAAAATADARRAARTGLIVPPSQTRSRTPATNRVAALPGGAMRPMTDDERVAIRRGDRLMREGDIKKAREFYIRAQKGNVPEAYLALGRSYDPYYLNRISNPNDAADSARALELYRQALGAGLVSAQVKIDRLVKSMAVR